MTRVWLHSPSFLLFGIWAGLCLFGLVMVTSASMEIASSKWGSIWHFSLRHCVHFLVASLCLLAVWLVPLNTWYRLHRLIFSGGLLLLGLVLIPYLGQEVNGSQRWIRLPVFSVQPAELFKLCFILYMAGFIARIEAIREGQNGLIRIIFLIALPVALLLLQPDFGSAVLIVLIGLAMLLVAGFPLKRLFGFGLILAGLAVLAVLTQPYRMRRLIAFVDPWADKYQAGYQLTQSLIAFGRGDLWGLGLGQGIQKMAYLPEPHTDFVFAVIGEELGLVGTLLVLGTFAVLLAIGLILSWRCLDKGRLFVAFLAVGITTLIGLQAVINTGASIGLLPTKGLTLPLVSYGCSSLVVNSVFIGILLRIQYELADTPTEAS